VQSQKLRKLVSENPSSPVAQYGFGTALMEEKAWESALAGMREAARLNPQYPIALSNLRLLAKKGI